MKKKKLLSKKRRTVIKHMMHCEYMIDFCKRKSNDKKPHYFQKQFEVAVKIFKTLEYDKSTRERVCKL